MRPLRLAGGSFEPSARALRGAEVDWSGLALDAFAPQRLALARRVWADRARTEYRSAQVLTRFTEEVLGAGEPLDVAAWAAELVTDELRHALLCKEACEALGGRPSLPEPATPAAAPRYLAAPMADRALTTAISMLAISETISVAFIEDLAARCSTPGLSEVLRRTVEDEAEHGHLGWAYVEQALARYPSSTLPSWRHLVKTTLAPHREAAEGALADVPRGRRRLDDQPEPELAALGLFSPARQALVFEAAWAQRLEPRLAALRLL